MYLPNISEGWAVIISACIAIGGYALQAYLAQKRELEAMNRKGKEEYYSKMLKALHGFYVSSKDKELREKFIEASRISWLYASDDVIESINNFFNLIKIGAEKVLDDEKKKALGQILVNMRKDLGIKTELKSSDFEIWTPT